MKFTTLIKNKLHSVLDPYTNLTSSPSIRSVKAKSKKCFILGNGPSLLGDINLKEKELSSYDLCAVNFFANNELYLKLKPQFYCFADPLFNLVDNPGILNQIKDTTSWSLTIIAPTNLEEEFSAFFLNNSNISVKGYNINPFKLSFSKLDYFLHKKQTGTYGAMNVVNVATYLMCIIGFKQIYLLGVDHSWHLEFRINSKNQVIRKCEHFYDTEVPESYVQKDRFCDELQFSSIALRNYFYINDFAIHNSIEIYNCCKNSFIEAFPRITIEDALS